MFSLVTKPKNSIEFMGHKFKVNIAFDVIIKMFAIFKDEILGDEEKIDLACEILVGNTILSLQNKSLLVEKIINDFVNSQEISSSSDEKIVDYEQDAEYIYAGFLQSYGINLIKQQGILSFKEFIALFKGLPDNTKIKEIMSIRARPLPPPTKYNADERKHLIELKQYYALNKPLYEKNFSNGLASLFDTLKQRTVKK